MKKTIAALLALSGFAMGMTQTSVATGNTTATKSLIVTSSITLSDLTTIAGTVGTNTALLGVETGASNKWSIAVGTFSGAITLREYDQYAGTKVDGAGNQFTWIGADGAAMNEPALNTLFPLENAIGASITLGYTTERVSGSFADSVTNGIVTSYGNQGLAVVFSVKYADGTITSIYGINKNKYNKSSHTPTVYYDSDLLSAPEISESGTAWTRESLIAANEAVLPSISTPAVPEPTTATLSMLALAGLAARRRRK